LAFQTRRAFATLLGSLGSRRRTVLNRRPFTFAEFRSAISGSQFDLQARVDDPTAKNGS